MSELFGESFEKELSDVSIELERIRDLGQSVGNTLTRSLRGAIMDGRSLRSLLSDIGRGFADIALKAALKPLGTMVSGGIENLFSSLNPAVGIKPFAKGGVHPDQSLGGGHPHGRSEDRMPGTFFCGAARYSFSGVAS
jgi:hypothetical protein